MHFGSTNMVFQNGTITELQPFTLVIFQIKHPVITSNSKPHQVLPLKYETR